MGATNIDTITTDPNETLERAYDRLRAEAMYVYGHDLYNGSFTTTHGVRLATSTVMTRGEAQTYAEDRFEHDLLEKGGVAEGIALATEKPAEYRDIRTMQTDPVRISGATMRKVMSDDEALRAFIAKQLGVKASEVIDWQVGRGAFYPFTTTKWSAKTQAGAGKAVTRYFIINPRDEMMPQWDKGYPTQAAARAALKERLESARMSGFACDVLNAREASIIAMTKREDGSALVSGSATVQEVELASLSVRVGTLVSKAMVDRTNRSGWFIYGLAAE